jgi:hypothetical protein
MQSVDLQGFCLYEQVPWIPEMSFCGTLYQILQISHAPHVQLSKKIANARLSIVYLFMLPQAD